MTLLEAIKLELDTLPEEALLSVQEFVSFQKYRSQEVTTIVSTPFPKRRTP